MLAVEILFEQLLKGKRFVLVVDEAQNLDDSVLETVRMLSNFETHNAKLLQTTESFGQTATRHGVDWNSAFDATSVS
jgi:type II secretory pathway predicted ATPase ExeA